MSGLLQFLWNSKISKISNITATTVCLREVIGYPYVGHSSYKEYQKEAANSITKLKVLEHLSQAITDMGETKLTDSQERRITRFLPELRETLENIKPQDKNDSQTSTRSKANMKKQPD